MRDWKKDYSSLIKKIQETFRKKSLIVRSSAISEDGLYFSAGMYTSILDIKSTNFVDLKKAINKVIKSYPDKNDNNEVVQPMLKNVLISSSFH